MTTDVFSPLEFDRDHNGRPWVFFPDENRRRTLQRVTTLAKLLDDDSQLTKWKLRVAIKGVAMRRDLHAQAAATPLDDKKTLNGIAEAAMAAAEADAGANLGTSLHLFCAMAELGLDYTAPDFLQARVDCYLKALAELGITNYGGGAYIERPVVNVELGVAGTFDRLWSAPETITNCGMPEASSLPVIGDLKTQSGVDFSHISWAVQLASYANAETLYDPSKDEHTPMLPVNRQVALVAHLPVDGDDCTIYRVDIAQGIELARTAVRVREARRARTFVAVNPAPTEATELLDEPLLPATISTGGEATAGDVQHASPGKGAVAPAAPAAPPVETPPDATESPLSAPEAPAALVEPEAPSEPQGGTYNAEGTSPLAEWIRARMLALPPVARDDLRMGWPADMPVPKLFLDMGVDYTDGQADEIAELLDQVERSHEIPFGQPDPRAQRTGWLTALERQGESALVRAVDDEIRARQHDADLDAATDRVDLLANAFPGTVECPPEELITSFNERAVRSFEGDPVEPADIEAIGNAAAKLSPAQRVRIKSWTEEAALAEAPIALKANPTQRRFEIARALMLWVEHDDDMVAAGIAYAYGTDYGASFDPLGAQVGRMSLDQAGRFADAARGINAGTLVVVYHPDTGVPTIGDPV